MKRLSTLALTLMLSASQASALSCMRPDVADTFKRIEAADARFVVLLGSFEFPPQPRQPVSNEAQPQQVQATFTGKGLGLDGFAPAADLSVTLATSCSGPWCGTFPTPGRDALVFVEQTEAGYLLRLGACGGMMFGPEIAPIVEACMRGEGCESGELLP